jgi:N-dimethylarginine dimethylaminohydrolase
MSGEHSTLEKSVEEILIDLMAERVMSVGIQEYEEEESAEMQVGKLVEAIQQLQARVVELEIQAVSSTP